MSSSFYFLPREYSATAEEYESLLEKEFEDWLYTHYTKNSATRSIGRILNEQLRKVELLKNRILAYGREQLGGFDPFEETRHDELDEIDNF